MTDQNTDALRCAEYLDGLANEIDHTHFTDDVRGSAAHIRRLVAENEVIHAELMEQARLLGMSGEREELHLTVMRLALEALELELMHGPLIAECHAAITALRQSLGE